MLKFVWIITTIFVYAMEAAVILLTLAFIAYMTVKVYGGGKRIR